MTVTRRFLVDADWGDQLRGHGMSERVVEGWLPVGEGCLPAGCEIHVKRGADAGELTIGAVELQLTYAQACALLALCPHHLRYHQVFTGAWYVNFFLDGDLQGVVLAEVDLPAPGAPVPPPPLGVTIVREVTDDLQWHGEVLATFGIPL